MKKAQVLPVDNGEPVSKTDFFSILRQAVQFRAKRKTVSCRYVDFVSPRGLTGSPNKTVI